MSVEEGKWGNVTDSGYAFSYPQTYGTRSLYN